MCERAPDWSQLVRHVIVTRFSDVVHLSFRRTDTKFGPSVLAPNHEKFIALLVRFQQLNHTVTWCYGAITWCYGAITWCDGAITWRYGAITWSAHYVIMVMWWSDVITWPVGGEDGGETVLWLDVGGGSWGICKKWFTVNAWSQQIFWSNQPMHFSPRNPIYLFRSHWIRIPRSSLYQHDTIINVPQPSLDKQLLWQNL